MTEHNEVRNGSRKRGQFIGIEPDVFDSEDFGDVYEKMIYFSLRRFMNANTSEAYPGIQRLAKMSKCSDRKVTQAIQGLERRGWISVERRKNNTSLYTILDGPGTSGPEQRSPHDPNSVHHSTEQRSGELSLDNYINNNYKGDADADDFRRLFNLYLEKNIIQHKKPTDTMRRAVRARLKDFTVDELVQVINNYATVVHGHDYWFTHKYSFSDLMREKDVLKFVDEADPLNNFRGQPAFNSTQPPHTAVPQPKPVTNIDNLFTAGEDW